MKQNDFNHKFVDLIRNPNSTEEAALTIQIKDGPKLSAAKALAVYQEDYQARLSEALKNTYRAINSLIGDEDFQHLAFGYIKKYSSLSTDLDDYGNHFSLFLINHPLSDDYIFLSELAHFEWNFREIFHLEQNIGVAGQQLSEMINSQTTLVQLVNSARVFNYNYLITSLFALKDVDESKNIEEQDVEFDFQHSQYILMLKNNLMVKTHLLSKNQWEIVKKLLTPNILIDIFQNGPDTVTPEEIKILFQILGTESLLLKLN